MTEEEFWNAIHIRDRRIHGFSKALDREIQRLDKRMTVTKDDLLQSLKNIRIELYAR